MARRPHSVESEKARMWLERIGQVQQGGQHRKLKKKKFERRFPKKGVSPHCVSVSFVVHKPSPIIFN